jgi:hypothetical protein
VHLESDARQGGIESAWRLANPPPLPPHAAHVWRWFRDLAQTRPNNGMSITRIPRTEIAQWERDEGISLERWERRAILELDAAFIAAMTPKKKT